MKITKRDGRVEDVSFDKVSNRLKKLCNDINLPLGVLNIDHTILAQKVIEFIYDGVTTTQLDEEASKLAVNMTEILDNKVLAARIAISNAQKTSMTRHKTLNQTNKNEILKFSDAMELLYDNYDKEGKHAPILADNFITKVREWKTTLDQEIDYTRDYLLTYVGYKTLEKSYLQKKRNINTHVMEVVELPQHLYMRVALAINLDSLKDTLQAYSYLSNQLYTNASPTLFNAGTRLPNLASCLLMGTEDSIDGIGKTVVDTWRYSKVGYGIGINISNIRAKGSLIRGTNGVSDGIVPMCRVYDASAKWVNQSGKRQGSFSIFLEPWHADIEAFLELKRPNGAADVRARSLFYGVWMCDLFMKIKEQDVNAPWYLMCPDECPGLYKVYGEEFEELYWRYVSEGRYKREVSIGRIWQKILDAQTETGTPYISYKDQVNKKSNQKNIGTIRGSNLCVAPETKILTSTGYHQISDLVDKDVQVWNGQEFSETKVVKTGENQELIKVILSNGSKLECTKYHKFYLKYNKATAHYHHSHLHVLEENNEKIVKLNADQLEPGMELIDYVLPESLDTIHKVKIESVITTNRISDTYCFTEPKRGMGVFNGVLTGQCNEISIYSDEKSYGVCVLASIALPKYIEFDESGKPFINHTRLVEISKFVTKQLNKVLDITYYPTEDARKNSMDTRSIGIGIQGLADVYFKMGLPFDSKEAERVNIEMMESIYYGAVTSSIEEAQEKGVYPLYKGSPFSEGKLQFDLVKEFDGEHFAKEFGINDFYKYYLSERYDWNQVRSDLKTIGIRNSYLTALMPTASTAQIFENSECFEPVSSNFYKRRVLSGEFGFINKYLVKELDDLGLWDNEMKDTIIAYDGSIQNISGIPKKLKDIYKTAFEISMRHVIHQARDRGVFVDQMQSMNLFMESPTPKKLTNMHNYGWKNRLKSGMYYLRSRASSSAGKFSIDPELEKKIREKQELGNELTNEEAKLICSIDNKEACIACTS